MRGCGVKSTTWGMTSDPAGDWREKARCRPEVHDDPELFFPPGRDGASYRQVQKAKEFCVPCPVRTACLRWALTRGCDGVWGGTSQSEREQIARGHKPIPAGDKCPNGHPRELNARVDRAGSPYCVACRKDQARKSQEALRRRREAVMSQ